MDFKVIDLHMHVVPKVDDGARSMEEAIEMIKSSISQGVGEIFCTSHNGYTKEQSLEYFKQFEALSERVKKENLNVRLHQGCEILTEESEIDDILYCVDKGYFPTLGNSKCILLEFYTGVMPSEASNVVRKVVERGYVPIIAHMERNYNLSEFMVGLLVEMGALVQINAYSLEEETSERRRDRARRLLHKGYVHFLGTDAHQLTHRPPRMEKGIRYVLDSVSEDYARKVLYENAERLILNR
jgi:protein-tyrosine phosphatase